MQRWSIAYAKRGMEGAYDACEGESMARER